MTTHRVVRVEIAGLGLTDRIETFSTTIIASNEELARGAHRAEALWRAGVRGLRGSLRVVGEHVGMPVSAPPARHLRSRPWRDVASVASTDGTASADDNRLQSPAA